MNETIAESNGALEEEYFNEYFYFSIDYSLTHIQMYLRLVEQQFRIRSQQLNFRNKHSRRSFLMYLVRNFSMKINTLNRINCFDLIHTRRCSLINQDSNALNKTDVAIPASNRPTNNM